MSKVIYLLFLGIIVATGTVLYVLYKPSSNEEKKISVPVVNKIIDAKPVVSKKRKSNKKNKLINLETIRVNPQGGVVVAGKVFPNSKVEIISNGIIIAQTVSEKTGEFVAVSKNPLSSGDHILAFRITTPEKKIQVANEAIAIKISKGKEKIPIVAIIDAEAKKGAKVVQAPGLEKKKNNNKVAKSKLPLNLEPKISILSLTNNINLKQIILTGYSIGGIQVDAMISGKEVFSGKIIDNEWSVTLPNQLISGKQTLVARLIGKNGEKLSQDKINFFGKIIKDSEGKTIAVVQKGDALWKIAYQRLGGGDKYFDILKLNKNSIKNPDLIFPKQLFVLPK